MTDGRAPTTDGVPLPPRPGGTRAEIHSSGLTPRVEGHALVIALAEHLNRSSAADAGCPRRR